MKAALEWDAKELTYHLVRKKLDQVVAAFFRKHGWKFVERTCGSFEDLRSLADEVFTECYLSYDESKGASFKTWVGYKTWKEMLSLLKRRMHRGRLLRQVDLDDYEDQKSWFDVRSFTEGLSEPAREAVNAAIFDVPADVMLALAQKHDDGPRAIRAAVREYLIDMGRTSREVSLAFAEIRKALG